MPEIHVQRCTRFRYRYSECQRCLEVCPHDAITLSDEGAALVTDRCQNCGLCISACHTQAWSDASFKPIDTLRQAIQKSTFSLACEPSGCSADATVPCLGAVDAVWLAYMAKRRIPVTLLGSDHCKDCAHGKIGAVQLKLNLEAVALLQRAAATDADNTTASVEWSMPVLMDDQRDSHRQHRASHNGTEAASRRSFFKRIFRDKLVQPLATTESGKPTVVPPKAIRAGAYMLSEQRELLQIVTKNKDDQAFSIGWHENLPLLQLSLQPGCTLCEACFRVCPTGAIQIEQDPGNWALTFQTDRCVACEVCLEVCQPQVLGAAASFDARPGRAAVTLIHQNKQRCSRCDRHFVSPTPQKTCPVCGDDEEAFDAIFGAD